MKDLILTSIPNIYGIISTTQVMLKGVLDECTFQND